MPNEQGLHLRPVTAFVDLAARYKSTVSVKNVTRDTEEVNGKSAMDMVLLEATRGSVLRITARGADARETVAALEALVEAGFKVDSEQRCE